MASRLVALKERAMAAAGAADVGLIIALGHGNATDNPLARLRTSTKSTDNHRRALVASETRWLYARLTH
jgi:hypothetical protein